MQQGARTKAALVLIEIETDTGLTGVGECMAIPNARFIQDIYEALRPLIIGANPFEIERIWQQAYRQLMALPASDMDRMARLALAGLDFALHDLMGKALNLPVYSVLGGAVHDDIRYFAFIDGETPEKVATMGREYVEQGIKVFYLKLGRGEGLDIACTAALRGAIGERRLRVDPNEAWDVHQAIRMIRMLSPY
ncbi:MAG: mandelate racemase/muconate lactonizing enzyme family protein, partial [Lewinella sp.]|nr:mandelate racemase/muconate lactonizing enzyme family protein [Lewinella sp.]